MLDKEKIKARLVDSFTYFKMAGCSESPAGDGHLFEKKFYHNSDVVRNIGIPSSKIGLFKENRDIYFWWFSSDGNVIHENVMHTNNVGLISRNDYSVRRQNDEFRIAVLGDEMTGATTARVSWPDFLETFLNHESGANLNFRVYNFGHLDTGVHEWRHIWEARARNLDVDLVIVNLADHSLVRIGEVYSDVSHWDTIPAKGLESFRESTLF